MKTDRFRPASARVAVISLAVLFLASLPTAGQFGFRIRLPTATHESSSKKVAKALAGQVGEVRTKLDTNRRALRTVEGPGGEPAYLRQEVSALIARTEADLEQAIERVGEPGLEALEAWAVEELQPIKRELIASPERTAALSFVPSRPRATAMFASLRFLPPPKLARAGSPQETIPTQRADRLLDQVGNVIGRIFFLADRDDLEVKLWVGSMPAQQATFRFWPQGKIKGDTPAPLLIRTNGKRDHVLRGLYSYRAGWTQGAVTQLVSYPSPTGPLAGGERLDLVNGSSYFCCRFKEQYCHHVANEKECRP